MTTITRQQESQQIKKDYPAMYSISLAIVILLIGMWIGGFLFHGDDSGFSYSTNLYTEIISIAITVLIIEQFNQRRAKREQVERDQRQVKEQWKRDQSQQISILRRENIVVKRQPIIDHMKTQDLFKGYALLDSIDLRDANLYGCNMQNASLVNATLLGAVMIATNLQKAMLHNTNLLGAVMIDADLEETFLLEATLPDNTKYTSDTKMEKFTDPTHPEFKDTLEKINIIREKWGFPRHEIISISSLPE